ncbi:MULTISPECIES: multicopper oxidase domain-containing protein [unclassified Actinomadura]|uniref:multicopper oxidase domain-containing protein n=1 Tax=unclassified Actinomadura TaxID=2626254 RepID=UPI0013595B9C|nr:multicopper oxidase domain-containing protein [Actinomadura sp. K4S16]
MVSASPGHGPHRLASAAGGAASSAGGVDAALPGAGKKVTLEFEEGDMYIKPNKVTVPAGADVTVKVVNKGSQPHTLNLEGRNGGQLEPGTSATQHWGVLTESTQAWCVIPGHKDAGMLVEITVTGGKTTSTAAAGGGAAVAADDGNAKIDPAAKPPAGWKAHDPTAPVNDGKDVHEATFTVTEKEMEVAPGVKQVRWTFNGTAPGPTLRGKVGDTFKITLVNRGTMAHSIDFHASKVAPNVQMRTIKPGESLVYEFEAQFSGIFTYHCGADPMIYHMGNGMYGALIVDPPDLGKVDKELVLVQSELYLGPQGKPGDLKKMLAGRNDAVVLNGYHNQYVHSPIKVKPGERVRVWVDDSGPNENIAFHVVGTIFDTVWKEGQYTLRRGNPEKGGSQVLDLQPTQGGFVEFTLPDAGTYPFLGHKMMNMANGGLGLFQVG